MNTVFKIVMISGLMGCISSKAITFDNKPGRAGQIFDKTQEANRLRKQSRIILQQQRQNAQQLHWLFEKEVLCPTAEKVRSCFVKMLF